MLISGFTEDLVYQTIYFFTLVDKNLPLIAAQSSFMILNTCSHFIVVYIFNLSFLSVFCEKCLCRRALNLGVFYFEIFFFQNGILNLFMGFLNMHYFKCVFLLVFV